MKKSWRQIAFVEKRIVKVRRSLEFSCFENYQKEGFLTSKINSERGVSEAAAGRFASVAAKLVKTATQIPIYIRVK